MAKQRQVRIEQGLPQNLMEDMQERTNEQLETETKYRSIALAILGARAAERYDAPTARTYFQRAIAASRPQERMQIRRMADASLALAERRAGDLKVAVERLGGEAPSGRALMGLRLMGLIAPPPGSGVLLKARGFGVVALIVIILLAAGLGVVELVSLPFGGVGFAPGLLLGLIVVGVALSILAFFGRRRQRAARPGLAGKAVTPAGKPSLLARISAGRAASAAKGGTTDAKGPGRGTGGGGGTGAPPKGGGAAKAPARGGASTAAAKGTGSAGRSRQPGKPSAGGSSGGSSSSAAARRGNGGSPRGASGTGKGTGSTGGTGTGAGTGTGTGTAKGAAPGPKPTKRGSAPPAKKGPARPKRPSR